MELNFVSVTAKDLERAKNFYRKLLDREPDGETERLVTFKFEGVEFGIHYPPADGTSLKEFEYGNNTFPGFRGRRSGLKA